jgi:hypothetical protein
VAPILVHAIAITAAFQTSTQIVLHAVIDHSVYIRQSNMLQDSFLKTRKKIESITIDSIFMVIAID